MIPLGFPSSLHALVHPLAWLLLLLLVSIPSSAHKSSTSCKPSVIIIGAGMSGIMAAKTLSDNGVKDFLILEATDRIGGRMHQQKFAGYTVELGANWVEGVGGEEVNPIWKLAKQHGLRMSYSDFTNVSLNIYSEEKSGKELTKGRSKLRKNLT